MKFVYEYRTKDNALHSGVVSAVSRDAAFAALKSRGIRPSRLADAPGFFNRLFGRGKRWLAIVFLAVALIAALLAKVGADHRVPRTMHDARSAARHQIYGDPVVMEELEANGYTNVFSRPLDCLLARFAQPGVAPSGLERRWREKLAAAAAKMDDAPVALADADSREVRELKQIVNGMRDELRRYLANGNGTPQSYARRLEERQLREYRIYESAKAELEKETDHAKWLERNAALRALGIRTVPLKTPESENGI